MDERLPVFDEDYEKAKVQYWKERAARQDEYWRTSPNPNHAEFGMLEKPYVEKFKQSFTPRQVGGEQVSGKVRKLKALRERALKRGKKGGLYYETESGRRVYMKE
jgi:hypothetical protein